MTDTLTRDVLIGNFEAAHDDTERANDLASQVREIKKDVTARLNEFAADYELEPKAVKAAYKRYCDLRKGGGASDGDEDFYTMLTYIDESFAEEED